MICYTKSCEVLKAEAKLEDISDDDLKFWSFIQLEERPATVHAVFDDEDDEDEEANDDEESEEEEDETEDMDYE